MVALDDVDCDDIVATPINDAMNFIFKLRSDWLCEVVTAVIIDLVVS